MPVARGSFIAARPKTINFQQGRRAGQSKASWQLAFIPRADPHGFPALLTCDEETFNSLADVEAGQAIEVKFIETALDERIAVGVASVA